MREKHPIFIPDDTNEDYTVKAPFETGKVVVLGLSLIGLISFFGYML